MMGGDSGIHDPWLSASFFLLSFSLSSSYNSAASECVWFRAI